MLDSSFYVYTTKAHIYKQTNIYTRRSTNMYCTLEPNLTKHADDIESDSLSVNYARSFHSSQYFMKLCRFKVATDAWIGSCHIQNSVRSVKTLYIYSAISSQTTLLYNRPRTSPWYLRIWVLSTMSTITFLRVQHELYLDTVSVKTIIRVNRFLFTFTYLSASGLDE